jgi:soluble lytic murein transglycosylase
MAGKSKVGEYARSLGKVFGVASVLMSLLAAIASEGTESPPEPAAAQIPYVNPASAPTWLQTARQEFLRGYQAERSGDHEQAVRVLGSLSGHYPELGDYVLFYLGCAQSKLGSSSAATESFERLLQSYPQSILARRSELELAKLALSQEQFARAEQVAAHLLLESSASELEDETRITLAAALVGLHDIRGANAQLQLVRLKFPGSVADGKARIMQSGLRKLYPDLIGLRTAGDFRSEAELLLQEGLPQQALKAVDRAFALMPSEQTQIELLWIEARAAAHVDRVRQKRALDRYLELAPDGWAAPQATYALGMWYWHADQTEEARLWFGRVASEFPEDPLASQAMLRMARIAEEQHELNQARIEYLRLAARYPHSEAGEQARFRAPWMLYMSGNYSAAATQFGELREQASVASMARDKFGYWEARAWEKLGRREEARARFAQIAQSLDSDYYPALAAIKVNEPPPVPAAAEAADFVTTGPPPVVGPAAFHLARVSEFAALGLKPLMTGELLALNRFAGKQPSLRDFVLAELRAADDYYDAIMMAIRMEQRGELPSATAERLRYPRAYWNWVTAISARTGLEPYLLLAVARQESLFNPRARSASDARGLMQVLPTTADRLNGASHLRIDLYDPQRNLELGALELRRLLDRFGGDLFRALAAYNAGQQAVDRWNARYSGDDDEWVENIEYKETRHYVKKVIAGLRQYRLIYGSAQRDFSLNYAGIGLTPMENLTGGLGRKSP